MRTSAEKRLANRSERSRIELCQKNVAEAATGGDKAKIKAAMDEYFSVLDKAVKHGVLKANAADRRKSRAAKRLK